MNSNTESSDQDAKVIKKEKKFICDFEECDKSYAQASKLRWHVNKVHLNKRPYKCTFDGCDKSYPNPYVLKEHILNSHSKSEEKKFICNYEGCGQSFIRPSTLKCHMNVHLNERPYKCTVEGCDKSYTNPSHLKRHVGKHDPLLTIVKKYRCEICKENFSYSGSLQRHFKRFHSTDNAKYCSQCKKSFRKRSLYEDHIQNFHKLLTELRFECDQCGAVLTCYKTFKKHKKRHLMKRYACYVKNCSEEFYTRSLLTEHLKASHVFRYTCDHCNKTFWVKRQLRVHILNHMDNRKTFHCTYKFCNRIYFFKRNLTQHIRSFHLGKKFKCDICNLKLSSKQKLDQHKQKMH